MTRSAKAQEPSMEEIWPPSDASLPTTMPARPRSRRSAAAKASAAAGGRGSRPPVALPQPAPPPAANNQSEIDAMLADLEYRRDPRRRNPRRSRGAGRGCARSHRSDGRAAATAANSDARSGADLPHASTVPQTLRSPTVRRSGAGDRAGAGRGEAHLRAADRCRAFAADGDRGGRARSTRWRRPCW